ncbi:MAG: PAS domain-containing protein [Rhizomicrobium sp.]
MPAFDKQLAIRGFGALTLAPESRRILDYWLSLWEGCALPQRARFEPVRIRDLLPGVMIMEVKPGERVMARLSGSAVNAAVGMDLTGKDLLALTRDSDRRERLERNSQTGLGNAGWCIRRGARPDGSEWSAEEIHLPFRDMTEDGARLVLYHATFKLPPGAPPLLDLAGGLGLSETFGFISLIAG